MLLFTKITRVAICFPPSDHFQKLKTQPPNLDVTEYIHKNKIKGKKREERERGYLLLLLRQISDYLIHVIKR